MDYQTLRNGAKEKGINLYPPYNSVREEKKNCIPGDIIAEDYKAEVSVQELLDHTIKRILQTTSQPSLQGQFTMTSKVGFDGCTGQSVYKQLPSEGTELASIAVEESLFLTCMVPLQVKNTLTDVIIWQNPKPSSTHYCRPIR